MERKGVKEREVRKEGEGRRLGIDYKELSLMAVELENFPDLWLTSCRLTRANSINSNSKASRVKNYNQCPLEARKHQHPSSRQLGRKSFLLSTTLF